ncbi:MAG: hypothetical protein JXA42_22600 [Anaerolineales bacterium]|nr:hypothetical protein [Anaerolineales bacterium]
MSISSVLSTAWQIVRKNKYLWILGFMAGLMANSNQVKAGTVFVQGGAWTFNNLADLVMIQNVSTVMIALISLLLWPIGTLARIGMVSEAAKLDDLHEGHNKKFGQLFRNSSRRLLPILLMQVLLGLPVIIQIFFNLAIRYQTNQYTLASFLKDIDGFSDLNSIVIPSIVMCGLYLFSIPAAFVEAFSFRSMVIENLGVKEGILQGITIFTDNWTSILGLSFIIFIIGYLYSLLIASIQSPILLTAMGDSYIKMQRCMSVGNFERIRGCLQQFSSDPMYILIYAIIVLPGAALSSVWIAYQSAAFTVAYQRFIHKDRKDLNPDPA